MSRRGRPPHPDILTPREWEVLACIREELSNEEIAGRLGISLDGVKYHVTEILSKLGLENRHDAARWRPEEPRRWWAALPLLFWRRLGGWLSPALAGGLAVAVAAGIGLLVWALVATGSGNGTTSGAILAGTPTPYNGPLAAYAVVALSSGPYDPLYLKAIDPFTGAAVPGKEPIELGHDGTEALSPDGATIALGWAGADSGGSGPYRLSLLDTATWKERDTDLVDGISRLFWSPDGSKIYVVTFACYACNGKPTRLITVDVHAGKVTSEAKLPFDSYPSFLSPDGTTLYLFGHETYDPQVVAEPPPPRLVALDVKTGTTRAELTLSGMLDGSRKEHDASGDYYAEYSPGLAMSPDGRRLYLAYPDSERIAVVDLPGMRVDRTVNVERQQTSLIGRFLSLFASKAEAKGGPMTGASLSVSADGKRLYYSRSFQRPPADDQGNYQTTAVGPWILDPDSLHITKELAADAMVSHGFFPGASGRYIFALRGIQVVVLDPTDLHELSGGDIGAVSNLLVGPAPPANR
jgi:DNA-binding CsgD family transcriptional regulator